MSDRIELFRADLNALLYKHGFEGLKIVEMDSGVMSNSQLNMGILEENDNETDWLLLGFSISDKQHCPCCAAKE